MKKSNRFQIDAFVAQFSSLFATEIKLGIERYVHGPFSHLSGVRVARVTPELMQHTPESESYSSGLTDWHHTESVLLFDAQWCLLGTVRQNDSGEVHGSRRWSEDGESVGEAIARIGCADTVTFVVSIRDDSPHEGPHTVEVAVCKPPKGWTIPEWIERERQRAQAEIDARMNDIDTVS